MKKEKIDFKFLIILGGIYLIFSYLSYLIDIINLIVISMVLLVLIAIIGLLVKIRYFHLLLDEVKLVGIEKFDSVKYNYQPTKYLKIFLVEFFISFSLLLYVIYIENHVNHSDFYSFILAPIVSFLLARAINNFIQFLDASSEESNKRTDDLYKLKEYYHDNYLKSIKVIDRKGNKDKYYQFMYDSVIDDFSDKKLTVIDEATDFALPALVNVIFYKLLKANSTSTIKNFTTVRLNNVVTNDNSVILYIGRSKMYYDLVTNRIPDLTISGITTIRDLYEEGPKLSLLSKSQMSNHIGINVIVTLESKGNTKEVVLPIRDGFATMSKYQTTSSLAFGLADKHKDITSDCIRYKIVEEKLREAYNVSNEYINKIELIGIGRDIYSVGKPQLYYSAELKLDSTEFLDCYLAKKTSIPDEDENVVNKAKKVKGNFKIDDYKYISIVSIDELLNLKHRGGDKFELKSNVIHNDLLSNVNKLKREYGKTVCYVHRFEKSFFANLYHYFIHTGQKNNVKEER